MTTKDKIEKSIQKILQGDGTPTTRSVADYMKTHFDLSPSTSVVSPILRKWRVAHLRKIERVKVSYLKLDAIQRREFRRKIVEVSK